MFVSFVSPVLQKRATNGGSGRSAGQQTNHALIELLSLVSSAPTLSSLGTLRSVRLTRLTEQPVGHFRLSNEEAALVMYPIDEHGYAQSVPLTRRGTDIVQFVCISEMLHTTQQPGVSA